MQYKVMIVSLIVSIEKVGGGGGFLPSCDLGVRPHLRQKKTRAKLEKLNRRIRRIRRVSSFCDSLFLWCPVGPAGESHQEDIRTSSFTTTR